MTDNISEGGKVHTDAWSTERAAAEQQTSARKREAYDQITDYLRRGREPEVAMGDEPAGLTDDELRFRLQSRNGRASKSGPATRRGELVDLGYVRPQRNAQGEVVKRPSDLGGPMIVWELVPGDEYVAPSAPSERQPNASGLAVARRYAGWETGDDALAASIIRAYLNPGIVADELDDVGAL